MPTEEHTLQKILVSYLRLRHFIVVDCDIMDGLKYAKDSIRYSFIIHNKSSFRCKMLGCRLTEMEHL